MKLELLATNPALRTLGGTQNSIFFKFSLVHLKDIVLSREVHYIKINAEVP